MKKKAWVFALLLIIFVGTVHGEGYTNVAGIFQLGVGGRPAGMGGAFLALADDENAVFYNPAGLGRIDTIGLTTFVSRRFETITYAAIGLAVPHFGVYLLQLDSGWIGRGEDPGFRFVSRAGILSAGVALGPVALGGRWKFYRVESPYTASGWAFDPALLIGTDTVRVGIMLENLFSQPITFADGRTEAWEPRTRVGIALSVAPFDRVRWSSVRWNAVVEGSGFFSAKQRITAGLEAQVGALAVRIGYDGAGATFGLTVSFASFQVDWAYITHPTHPDSHRVSLTLRL